MAHVHNGEPTVRERSPKWREDRIEMLTQKKKNMKFDFETRSKNIEAELKEHKAVLKKNDKK